MNVKKRFLGLLICGVMLFAWLPVTAFAVGDGDGALQVEGGTLGTDYSYADNVLTIKTGTPLTISGTTTTDRIVVSKNLTADITLKNLSIDMSSSNQSAFSTGANLSYNESSNITLTIQGENTLIGGNGRDGLQIGADTQLTISEKDAGDSLTLRGGNRGDGLSAGGSTLTIKSGTINAYGGNLGAGIGGNSATIEIEGGTIHAEGGECGVGIGGSNGTITISGGVVEAIGGDPDEENSSPSRGGCGIGGSGCEITISGGVVAATGKDIKSGIEGESFSTGENGNAIIFSNTAITAGNPEEWRGVIFQDCSGQVYASGDDKTVTLPAALEIPADKVLTIPEGVTLVNNHGITGSGTIIQKGALAGTGTVGDQITTASLPEDCEISDQGTVVTAATGRICTSGNYYLIGDTTRSSPLIICGSERNSAPEDTVVNLCLHGYSLSCENGSVIVVQNATLNLYDCQKTGKVTGGNVQGTYDSCKTGNGLYVYMNGGGLTAKDAVVNLYGGTITGNTCNASNPQLAGGVYLSASQPSKVSKLTIHEGVSISNNTGPTGGICANSDSTIIMTGGAITGNTSNLNYGPTAGGISLQLRSKFEMSGGEISGNTAAGGGGITVHNPSSSLTLTGGRITGNKTTSSSQEYGGGIYFMGSATSSKVVCNLSGAPYIYGNTNQDGEPSNITDQSEKRLFTLTGALDDGAKIGFALSSGLDTKLVAGWNQYMNGKTISDYFVCDLEDMGLKRGDDGDLILAQMYPLNKMPAEHGSFILKVDGDETEQACAGDTVTIVPQPDEGYTMDSVSVAYTQGTGSVSVTDNQFTMPSTSGGVTITVTFKLKSYEVTFDSQGGSEVPAQSVEHGGTVSQPSDPTRAGYTFGGWYQEPACINPFDFDSPIIKTQTLYAKWTQNSSGNSSGGGTSYDYFTITASAGTGGSISPSGSVRVRERLDKTFIITPDSGYRISDVLVDGTSVGAVSSYTFENVRARHTIEAVFAKQNPDMGLPFTDVPESAWYYDAVRYVYEHGLMNGTSATTFSPNAVTTRGQIVTILWRVAGSPVVNYLMDYNDVDPAAWYGEAVRWATSEGVVKGYGNGRFGPDDPITREQFAAILYRYAQYKGYDVTASADLSGYADADKVSGYALEAMRWANAEGIINGTSPTTLYPQGTATRAQAAAMLMRFCERYTQ